MHESRFEVPWPLYRRRGLVLRFQIGWARPVEDSGLGPVFPFQKDYMSATNPVPSLTHPKHLDPSTSPLNGLRTSHPSCPPPPVHRLVLSQSPSLSPFYRTKKSSNRWRSVPSDKVTERGSVQYRICMDCCVFLRASASSIL